MQILSFHLTNSELAILAAAAIFVGMAKTGVHGAGMIAVPMLAMIFGGQASSGILLPILCISDILGVWYYHRHASWEQLRRLFPSAASGTIAGTVAGYYFDDNLFRLVMATVIFIIVILMIWMERTNRKRIPSGKWFSSSVGFVGGFTSMIGNLAGSVMALYFLSVRLPKSVYIGTTAWFFLAMNFFKLPLHVFFWKTISVNSLLLDLLTIPFIIAGAVFGIFVVKNLSESLYRWFIIIMTLIAAILMLVKA